MIDLIANICEKLTDDIIMVRSANALDPEHVDIGKQLTGVPKKVIYLDKGKLMMVDFIPASNKLKIERFRQFDRDSALLRIYIEGGHEYMVVVAYEISLSDPLAISTIKEFINKNIH